MKFINSQVLINKLNMLTNDLNNLFIGAEMNIKNILKKHNINTRNRVLTFQDVLCYKFNYIYKYSTQLSAINEYIP